MTAPSVDRIPMPSRDRVLAMFSSSGKTTLTNRELAELFDVPSWKMSILLCSMRRKGQVKQHTRGHRGLASRWSLPPQKA